MTAVDDARRRHPSASSGIPVDSPSGVAGPAVHALPPRGMAGPVGGAPDRPGWDTPHQLRRQRRQILACASVLTVALVLLARAAPTLAGWILLTVAMFVLWSALVFVLWVGVFELGHWQARRRARRFNTHTQQALDVIGERL